MSTSTVNNACYLYVLLDPTKPGDYQYGPLHFKFEPFYVGISSQTIGVRPARHYDDKHLHREIRVRQHGKGNWQKAQRIIRIKRTYPTPFYKIIKRDISPEDSKRLERKAIALIGLARTSEGLLLNLTLGGDGQAGYPPTLETRKKLSVAHKQRWAEMSDEQYAYMCLKATESNLKKWENMTPEELKKRSLNLSKGNTKFWASLTPEEAKIHRQMLSARSQATWDNMTREERADFVDRQNQGKARMTAEQREERSRKLSMSGKQFWASMSKEEREERIENITAGVIRSRPQAIKTFLKTIAALPPEQRQQWSDNIANGLRNFIQNNPERRAEMDKKRSETAQARTPEQRRALREKFREVQLNLPEEVQRAKNAKVSRGNTQYRLNMTEADKQREGAKLSHSLQRYWDNVDEATYDARRVAIVQGYAKKPIEEIAAKNDKISDAIQQHHASMSLFDKRIRAFAVMVGVLCTNAGITDLSVKAALKQRAVKFYSNPSNLSVQPTLLREKARAYLLREAA